MSLGYTSQRVSKLNILQIKCYKKAKAWRKHIVQIVLDVQQTGRCRLIRRGSVTNSNF